LQLKLATQDGVLIAFVIGALMLKTFKLSNIILLMLKLYHNAKENGPQLKLIMKDRFGGKAGSCNLTETARSRKKFKP